jgi:hypothetical protein
MMKSACVLTVVVLCWAAVSEAQMIEAGSVKVQYDDRRGGRLEFDGVPLSHGSSIQLYAPGWTAGYYSSSGQMPKVEKRDDAIVATHAATKAKFTATETIKPASKNRIEIILTGKLEEPAEAQLEWAVAQLSAFALYGGAVAAGNSDVMIPVLPEPAAQRTPINLIGETNAVRLQTRTGKFLVNVEAGPAKLTILDGRRAPDRPWARSEPTLWLGFTGLKLKAGEPFEFRVSIDFTPKKKPDMFPDNLGLTAESEKIEQAYLPTTRPVQIIPKPASLQWTEGRFAVSARTRIALADPEARPAAESIRRDVKQRFGWDWQIVEHPQPGDVQFEPTLKPTIRRLAQRYAITCTPNALKISACAKEGFFYGAQTLGQLLELTPDGIGVRACEITDSPSLEFRGVHYYPSRDTVDVYKKLAERVLSRFKFNHVVFECEYTQWDTDKKIWVQHSIPKSQLAEYIKISRDNGLEPIPLVQSLGHMEWMFKNGANRELAEDPDLPYAYAVTEPRSYDFIHGIDAEAVGLFKPVEYFHIGHDEVDMRGRYPHRTEAKKLGKSKLFLEDVRRHDEFFRKQGMKMMLWGDMLLAKGEANDAASAESRVAAKERRDGIPKDAVIADWHYGVAPPADYTSLKLFKDEGFKTIACTWYRPENIANFAAAARKYGAWGLLQTTWAGYQITDEAIDREMRQFAAYVLAAEYSWSADSPPPEKLPWRAERVFADAMNPRREATAPLAGTLIKFNGDVVDLDKFLGYADLTALAKDDRIEGIRFRITQPLTLKGPLLPIPTQFVQHATLETNVSGAGELAFLHATGFRAPVGTEVARYEIDYTDDSTEKIPLRYGREIRAWDDTAPAIGAPGGWFGQTATGVPAAVRVFRWTNPHPEMPIKAINLATDHAYASATLFAVTALGSR